jgi:hypothetical protein
MTNADYYIEKHLGYWMLHTTRLYPDTKKEDRQTCDGDWVAGTGCSRSIERNEKFFWTGIVTEPPERRLVILCEQCALRDANEGKDGTI